MKTGLRLLHSLTMSEAKPVLIRGGGDLATGVALRLYRAGIKVVITELAQPLAVRRAVAFSEAVYEGSHTVEGVTAKRIGAEHLRQHWLAADADEIPVLIDQDADILNTFSFATVVDARLTKQHPSPLPIDVPLHIGLGPGFTAGNNCHAVIETRRSHTLGRVYWTGTTQPDSGQPEGDPRRVLRAPVSGTVIGHKQIGEHCAEGELIARVASVASVKADVGTEINIHSPFKGVLRGLIRPGSTVPQGMKIGDVDARDDAMSCFLVSDKALAIGGAVLEALLSKKEIRAQLFS
jgi:xanthine dehydrogenase accessory factor